MSIDSSDISDNDESVKSNRKRLTYEVHVDKFK